MNFTTKSAQKEAMSKVSRKYEDLVTTVVKEALKGFTKEERVNNKDADDLYWLFPLPHSHNTLVKRWKKVFKTEQGLEELEALATEWKEIKAAQIVPKQKSIEEQIEDEIKNIDFGDKQEDEVSFETFKELMKRFYKDVELENVWYTATRHIVVNGISGTRGIRTFYYLNGKMVKLNYLIAVLTKRQENNK